MEQSEFNLEFFEMHVVDHCNLFCKECSHFSPFFTLRNGKKDHLAGEFYGTIDELIRRNVSFKTIAVLGGEPFLHHDLASFLRELKTRYHKRIWLITNGFWLGKPDYDVSEIVKWVDQLDISKYNEIVEMVPEFDKKIGKLIETYPKCSFVTRNNKEKFTNIYFTKKYEMPTRKCTEASCVNMTSDGRLCRCPVAAHARDNPDVTQEFLDACDKEIFYNFKDGEESIYECRTRYPMKACGYCTAWKTNSVERHSDVTYYKNIIDKKKQELITCSEKSVETQKLTINAYPKVSVIIPCCNYGKWLSESIQSVMGQTYKNIETVLVDYGSTDDTARIMENHKGRAVVLSIPNMGYPNARNRGIAVATGEYILCLDADDRLLPNFLEEVMKVANSNIVVATHGRFFKEDTSDDGFWRPANVDFKSFWKNNQILACSLFSKQMWSDIGGYDDEMKKFEDWDFWLRAILKGYTVSVINSVLVEIRNHGDSVNKTQPIRPWIEYMRHKISSLIGFNEGEYLRMNPDVTDEVNRGLLASGWDHYVKYGYMENREGVQISVK